MAISIEDLRALAARVRAEAEAADELEPAKGGRIQWDLPDAARAAIVADLESGVYEESVREATAGDSEMTAL